ncbi:hypothetical protein SARU107417_10870 [Salinibacter ruber]
MDARGHCPPLCVPSDGCPDGRPLPKRRPRPVPAGLDPVECPPRHSSGTTPGRAPRQPVPKRGARPRHVPREPAARHVGLPGCVAAKRHPPLHPGAGYPRRSRRASASGPPVRRCALLPGSGRELRKHQRRCPRRAGVPEHGPLGDPHPGCPGRTAPRARPGLGIDAPPVHPESGVRGRSPLRDDEAGPRGGGRTVQPGRRGPPAPRSPRQPRPNPDLRAPYGRPVGGPERPCRARLHTGPPSHSDLEGRGPGPSPGQPPGVDAPRGRFRSRRRPAPQQRTDDGPPRPRPLSGRHPRGAVQRGGGTRPGPPRSGPRGGVVGL